MNLTSGDMQKEGYFHPGACATLREDTERIELVSAGWSHLAPRTSVASVLEVADAPPTGELSEYNEFYGQGDAAGRFVADLTRRIAECRAS